jgi:hypothetical protein
MSNNLNLDFHEAYKELRKDPDKSKILCIHALLGFDDGWTYTEQDYQKAIKHLETGMNEIAGGSSEFFNNAILWCRERINKLQIA